MPENHDLATVQHKGLAPRLSGVATEFLDGTGAYSTPASGPSSATQAQQEAGVSTTVYTSPGTQQFHPSAAKVWGSVNATLSALTFGHNISSITDQGTGGIKYSYTTAFSATNYPVIGTVSDGTGMHTQNTLRSSGSSDWQIFNVPSGVPTLADPSIGHNMAAFGDQ